MTKQQIKKSGVFSPGIIDGNVFYFLSAKDGFFFKQEGQEDYNRDDSGKFIKLDATAVIEARYQYLLLHQEKEMETEIQNEFERLGLQLVSKAQDIIKFIQGFECYTEKYTEDHKEDTSTIIFNAVLENANPEFLKQRKRQAELFFINNPKALETKQQLLQYVEDKNYELLYSLVGFKFGEPMATFNMHSETDMFTLKQVFSADVIEKTLTDLKEKGSLYLIAKINVEKKYSSYAT